MELDEQLRARLARLASEDEALDEQARQRIRDRVHARTARRPFWPWLLVPGFAGVALAAWTAQPSDTPALLRQPSAPTSAAPRVVPVETAPAEPGPKPLLEKRHRSANRPALADAGVEVTVPEDSGVERIWQQGAVPYQPESPEIPSSLQPDGRPMKKPPVIP